MILPKRRGRQPSPHFLKDKAEMDKRQNLIRISAAAVSLGLIAAGLFTGEHLQVLRNAIITCLSCIGIG